MAIKIAVELNKMSPFKNAIRLFDFGPQKLTLKGLSGYDLRGLIAPKGILRKYYSTNKSRTYIRALRLYFSAIRDLFKSEWENPEKYIIATNRGITAFLKLLKSILKTEGKRLSRKIVGRYFSVLRKDWATWESAKLSKSYVGSQGWKDFHRDLVKTIKKKYPVFQE